MSLLPTIIYYYCALSTLSNSSKEFDLSRQVWTFLPKARNLLVARGLGLWSIHACNWSIRHPNLDSGQPEICWEEVSLDTSQLEALTSLLVSNRLRTHLFCSNENGI